MPDDADSIERVEIDDAFSCARLTKASQISEDGRVAGHAFAPREGESYLSMNCLDLFEAGDRDEQLKALRLVLRTKMTVRQSHRLSLTNVGDVKGYVASSPPYATLDFRHEPEPDDQTHCGLYGLEYNDEVVQDLIAECVTDVVAAYEAGS